MASPLACISPMIAAPQTRPRARVKAHTHNPLAHTHNPTPHGQPRPSSRPSASHGNHGHNFHLITTLLEAYNFKFNLQCDSFYFIQASVTLLTALSPGDQVQNAGWLPSVRASCTVISNTASGPIFFAKKRANSGGGGMPPLPELSA